VITHRGFNGCERLSAWTASTERRAATIEALQGFNIRRWSERGLNYSAFSDLAADEIAEFGREVRERDAGECSGVISTSSCRRTAGLRRYPAKKSTTPVSRSYIAPAILMAPLDSICASTGLSL
jgi:hypothetical protein